MPLPVLVVDDDPAIRDMVAHILRRAGFGVDTASGGAEAIDRCATTEYGAVVLDLAMPAIGGRAVIEALGHTARRTKCVVLMSAGTEKQLDDVPQDLVHTKLRKPFDLTDLVAAVKGCVGGTSTAEPVRDNYRSQK